MITGRTPDLGMRRHSRNILALFIPGEEFQRANCCSFYIDPHEKVRAGHKRNPQQFYCCLHRKSIGALISIVLRGIAVSWAQWFSPGARVGQKGFHCFIWGLVHDASYQLLVAPLHGLLNKKVKIHTCLN